MTARLWQWLRTTKEPRKGYILIELFFEPRDLWIGCFWDRKCLVHPKEDCSGKKRLVLYFCLIPMVVLKVTI